MKFILKTSALIVLLFGNFLANAQNGAQKTNPFYSRSDNKKLTVADAAWKKVLDPNVYYIAREKGTERAYSGPYWDNHKDGKYYCKACGQLLFTSNTKFESGTGWPSFYKPATAAGVKTKTDADGYRTEVECGRCGAHLGHVFNDGPKPTGKRYCMNGTVLDFAAE